MSTHIHLKKNRFNITEMQQLVLEHLQSGMLSHLELSRLVPLQGLAIAAVFSSLRRRGMIYLRQGICDRWEITDKGRKALQKKKFSSV